MTVIDFNNYKKNITLKIKESARAQLKEKFEMMAADKSLLEAPRDKIIAKEKDNDELSL